jgi:hypothetical protein
MRRWVVYPLCVATVVAAASLAYAKPLPGLPSYTDGYRGWTKVNRRPIPPRASDPHYSVKNVYASKAKTGARYPYGTVIVKEGAPAGQEVDPAGGGDAEAARRQPQEQRLADARMDA